jgi:hypothetical protein
MLIKATIHVIKSNSFNPDLKNASSNMGVRNTVPIEF